MTPTYLVLKVLHVVAAVVLVGTSVAIGFWKQNADRSGDAKLIAYTLDGNLLAVRRFISPSAILLLLAGFGMLGIGHLPFMQTWIIVSFALLIFATVAGIVGIAPATRALRALVDEAARTGGDFDRAEYLALSRRWAMWHMVALLSGVVAIILMVFRPQ